MLLFGNFSVYTLVAIGIVLLFGMGIHEYAHALVADWWGDPTPRQMGRLTPNPIVHINWVGWLMFLFIGFGILGSVPINARQMRDPRWGQFWTSLAGPLSNLLQALIYAVILRITGATVLGATVLFGRQAIGANGTPLGDFFAMLLFVGVFYNVLLFVFNLIPLFPIDGWHIVGALLPGYWLNSKQVPDFIRQNFPPLSQFLQQPAYKWREWARASQYVFMALLFISIFAGNMGLGGLDIFSSLIGQPTWRLTALLAGV